MRDLKVKSKRQRRSEICKQKTQKRHALADLTECKDRIMDHIIRNLSADNDKYYIEQAKGSNTFTQLKKYQQQKDKDGFFKWF